MLGSLQTMTITTTGETLISLATYQAVCNVDFSILSGLLAVCFIKQLHVKAFNPTAMWLLRGHCWSLWLHGSRHRKQWLCVTKKSVSRSTCLWVIQWLWGTCKSAVLQGLRTIAEVILNRISTLSQIYHILGSPYLKTLHWLHGK